MTTINTPTGWDDGLKSILETLPTEQRNELLEVLNKNEELEKKNEELNKSLYLKKRSEFFWLYIDDNLKLKCGKTKFVEVKENKNYMWYKGREFTIKLPDYRKKSWYKKMHFFISDNPIDFSEYNKSPELVNQSYSENDFVDILNIINDTLNAHWSLWTFPDVTFPFTIKPGEQWYNLAYLFWAITWLNEEYYLKNRNILFLNGWTCTVQPWPRSFPCKLFLKLSN